MRELNMTELQQVSGGFGFGAMMNTNIQAILTTTAGRAFAVGALEGMAGHAMQNMHSGEPVTAATIAGSAAAGAAGGALNAATGGVGVFTSAARAGVGGAVGGYVQRVTQQYMNRLQEAEMLANGGV